MAAPIVRIFLRKFQQFNAFLTVTNIGSHGMLRRSAISTVNVQCTNQSPPNSEKNAAKSQKAIIRKQTKNDMDLVDKENLNTLVLQEMKIEPNNDQVSMSLETKLKNLRPALKTAGNLAAYVRESEALTKLAQLGVDLSAIEESNADATNLFVKLDFKNNVEPYLTFLHQLGVPNHLLALCITRNPMIFAESHDDLQLHIDYLKSKNFTPDNIIEIVTRAPQFLSMSIKDIDSRLGYLQKKFKLTGKEVRGVVAKQPKLIRVSSDYVRWHSEIIDFVGYPKELKKQMFLSFPKMFLMGNACLLSRHEYLHNEMKIPMELLAAFPQVYGTRETRLRDRHLFLEHKGRAQYDPQKENYVSLIMITTYNDTRFANEVAKATMSEYNSFLKTI